MNPLIEEWVQKAEGDFATATRELAVERESNFDAVCFHAQQAVEKYIKAFLILHRVDFPKTHDLSELLSLCLPIKRDWGRLRSELVLLSRAAVAYRYPGEVASREDAEDAMAVAKRMRGIVREALGL